MTQKVIRSSALLLTALLFAGLHTSCGPDDAVGKFAGSSVSSLQKGDLVLSDMTASCQRTVQAQQPIDQFAVDPETAQSLQICVDHIHASSALDVSRVLVAYFSALGELASSGTAAKPAAQQAKQSAGAIPAKASAPAAKRDKPTEPAKAEVVADLPDAGSAAGEIAKILDQFATENLRHKTIKRALASADPAVAQLTQTLEDTVQQDYVNELLGNERDKLANRFSRLAKNPEPKPAFGDLLTLNGQWVQVTAGLDARVAAAHAYIQALRQIRNGHAALVRQLSTGKLRPKDIGAALEPYAASLAELQPQIGRPF